MPRIAELSPTELQRLWEAGAPAIVPWGALEWHGEHLPIGLDGIIAESFAKRLAERTNGVLFPSVWLPITTLPNACSFQIRTETLRLVLDDMLASFADAGVQMVALITGHYAQGHLIEMYEAALRAMDDHDGILVLAGTPLQLLGDPSLLDHAARYETSQLLAVRRDLVWRDRLPEVTEPRVHAVLGDHPSEASVQEGESLINAGLDAWGDWLQTPSRGRLDDYYRNGFDELQDYVDRFYRGSWDDALHRWWETK